MQNKDTVMPLVCDKCSSKIIDEDTEETCPDMDCVSDQQSADLAIYQKREAELLQQLKDFKFKVVGTLNTVLTILGDINQRHNKSESFHNNRVSADCLEADKITGELIAALKSEE